MTQDARLKTFAEAAQKAMEKANAQLGEATDKNSVKPLATALTDEQSAYQALLQACKPANIRSPATTAINGGSAAAEGEQQRSQEEVDQLDLKQTENRYETEREASAAQQTPEQKESVQVANRLKELAQRQQDLNGKLKELQTALQEARTDPRTNEEFATASSACANSSRICWRTWMNCGSAWTGRKTRPTCRRKDSNWTRRAPRCSRRRTR